VQILLKELVAVLGHGIELGLSISCRELKDAIANEELSADFDGLRLQLARDRVSIAVVVDT
jgi:hypothetical protein